jgi:hypothetical protein
LTQWELSRLTALELEVRVGKQRERIAYAVAVIVVLLVYDVLGSLWRTGQVSLEPRNFIGALVVGAVTYVIVPRLLPRQE